jgi:AraC-like DNA-binding protein
MRFMLDNYRRQIGLGDIAEACSLSETYVSAAFKKATGQNVMAFLNRMRIEQASRLLVETGYGLEDIADRVGFSSYFYFCRIFKSITGIAPGNFRKRKGRSEDASPSPESTQQ